MSTTKKDVVTVKKSLSVLAVAGLAFGLSAPALSASAAPVPAWSGAAPEFAYVGDAFVNNGAAMTDDRTPTFVVDATEDAQVGSLLTVRIAGGGVLCQGDAPVSLEGSVASATCTSGLRLPLGKTVVEAVFTSDDGRATTEAVRADAYVAPQKPTIAITDYDPATDTVTVAGSSMPGGSLRVGQDVETDGGYKLVDVLPNGRWTTEIAKPRDKSGIESALILGSSSWFSGTYFDRDAPLKPSASAAVAGGNVVIDVESAGADTIVVRNADWKVIATMPVVGVAPTSHTRLTIPAPVGEAEYFVQAVRDGVESAPDFFTVNEGAGAADGAPVVHDVKVAGSRVVVTLEGAPGAVVTVTDSEGTALAVKRIGSAPTAQVVVPVSTSKSGAKLYVQQSRDGSSSDREDFTVPAP